MLMSIGTALLAGLAALGWFYRSQTAWVESAPYQREAASPARVLVVVYSRTGSTAAVAKTVARAFDADLLEVSAPAYEHLQGLGKASSDASAQSTAVEIEHAAVDPRDYDLVFLCSPTWWFRPAVPMWAFVERQRFDGAATFLLMTGNSRLKPELTEPFEETLRARGARHLGRYFAQRGRIFWQKSPAELEDEIRRMLADRRSQWPVAATP